MKEVTLSTDKVVKVFPLTYGYLFDAEAGVITETKHGAIMNATGMTEEDVRGSRINDVDALYSAVLQATYPDLYDEDGKLKKALPESDGKDNKKKA